MKTGVTASNVIKSGGCTTAVATGPGDHQRSSPDLSPAIERMSPAERATLINMLAIIALDRALEDLTADAQLAPERAKTQI